MAPNGRLVASLGWSEEPLIKFSLRRLLAVTALYAFYLAIMRPLGTVGIVLACVVATSLSFVVLIARVRDIVPIVMVTVGALLGALLGWLVLQPFLLRSVYGYDHGFGESAKSSIAAGVIGVVGGSLAMSWLLGWLGAGREWRGGADATVEERGKSE